jgi:dTDP-4-dehydrorhamnose 3,5-epimerase
VSAQSAELGIPGCHLLAAPVHGDSRGKFIKPFTANAFDAGGLNRNWAECFWSESRLGVVRGFHVQLPPSAHDKLIWAVAGESHSVLLDLRSGSPTFGRTESVRLDANNGRSLYAPEGVAHAFQAIADGTILTYLVTSGHDAVLDAGVRWDSAGVSWPLAVTEVSARDRALPALAEFKTPFRFAP